MATVMLGQNYQLANVKAVYDRPDTQCTYNVKFRGFRITILTVLNQKLLHILSVFVALVIQHAKLMPRIVICDLSDCTVFFHIAS